MAETHRIILLDDVSDIRELICSYLQMTLPIQCIEYSKVSELQSDSEAALSSQVAILDLELGPGQPSGIEAFKWLTSHNYKGKIFFLTGHGKSHPLVQEATKGGADILEKPISACFLSELIQKHLHPTPTPKGSLIST